MGRDFYDFIEIDDERLGIVLGDATGKGVPAALVIASTFFFSSRRRHTRYWRDWSSDVCSSDLEPVNATLSRPGCRASAAPVGPAPGSTFTTPGGRSACWQISASTSAVSGVVSAGFSTTVLPAASAGASFQAAIISGKFHGMIWPATPTGRGSGRPGIAYSSLS